MLSDARSVPDGSVFRADVAVVGGGPAGIALALALRAHGVSVLLLESGGFEPDEATTSLNEGTVVGDELIFTGVPSDLTTVRQRGLGGTGNIWGSVCRPLEPIDFEPRPDLDLPGWPFGLAELDPYYARSAPICNVLDEWDADLWLRAVDDTVDLRAERLDLAIFQMALPRKVFGRDHREQLMRDASVEVCLWANVVRCNVEPASDVITSVDVATTTGKRHRAEARCFVLATGGIEVPRLLLASNDVRPAGIGNDNDLVGRFFMDHIVYSGGRVLLNARASSTKLYSELRVCQAPPEVHASEEGARHAIVLASLVPPAEVRRSERLRGCAALLIGPPDFDGRALAAKDAVRARDIADIAGFPRRRHAVHPMLVEAEVRPDPQNRVVLSSERDSLGVPKVELRYRPSADDRDNLRRGLELLAAELGRTGAGRMQIERNGVDLEHAQLWGSAHHMGTTRMHVDPNRGVVDANGRVHATANLFVASSAVFPSVGFANPTFTIVALALRLADHLAERMRLK